MAGRRRRSRSAGQAPVDAATDAAPVEGRGSERRSVEWALLAALILLSLSRAALPFVPTMWAWSLNLQAFLSPISAWLPWGLATLVLIPAVARRVTPALERMGAWMTRAPVTATLAWACGAALLVTLIPDRAQFVGDFILREGTLREQLAGKTWYPQALPLDLAIHERFARWLMSAFGASTNGAGRVIGAVEAALLGVLAVRLARVLEARGAAAFMASSILFWGGCLTLFTGYNKAFSEMCLVTAAVGIFGLDVARRGRGLLPLGLALTLALLLHRSALGLLPAAALAAAIWLRRQGPGAWRRPEFIVAIGLPLIALIAMTPRIITIVTHIDPMHFEPETVRARGLLATMFGDGRALDMLNLVVMLAPLAIVTPLLGALAGRLPGRETAIVGALVIPFVLVVPFIHPGQGYIRDWDDFATVGVALSLAAAWLAVRAASASNRAPWIAAALTLGAAAPSLQWVLHGADLERGLARAEAFMTEPPTRTNWERYTTWQYLGVREEATDHLDRSARAYREAARAIDSPHILHQWAIVEVQRGNFTGARDLYSRLVARDPRDVFAWWMLAVAHSRLSEWDQAYRATRRVLALDPTHAEARQALDDMERTRPEVVLRSRSRPDSS